jgi:arylsulfatase A-like enzyme
MYKKVIKPILPTLLWASLFMGGGISETMGSVGEPTQRPSSPRRPNIVFILSDDQRFDTIHALGNSEIKTPNLDRLVQEGVSFRNHYIMGGTWGAVCMPSRNMMLTGRTLFHLASANDPSPVTCKGSEIPPEHVMLPELLGQNGYRTFITGKWHNGKAVFRAFSESGRTGPWGNMKFLEPTPEGEPFYHYAIPVTKLVPWDVKVYPWVHSTDIFADDAVEFIEKTPGDKPFFLYLAFHAPHDAIMAPKEFEAMYPEEKMKLPDSFAPDHTFDTGTINIRPFVVHKEKTKAPYTPEEMKRITSIYYAMISHLDARIGSVLKALEAKGELENTIIVFSSDNGFSLGDHGLNHKQSVYEQDVRVPLIIKGPGLPKNETRDNLCYLLDVYPTLCDLVGLPIPTSVEGKSLLPVICKTTKTQREDLYFSHGDFQRGCRNERYKLLEFAVPNKETKIVTRHTLLFDLQKDPKEMSNLADKPEYAKTLAEMRDLLVGLRDENGDTINRGSVFWKNHELYTQQQPTVVR